MTQFVPRAVRVAGILLLIATLGRGVTPPAQAAPTVAPVPAAPAARVAPSLDPGRALFVPNDGQFDPAVRFQVNGSQGALQMTEAGIWATLVSSVGAGVALRLSYAGANPRPRIEGIQQQETVVSYLYGRDSSGWRAGLPTWGGVRYVDIFPGIDLEVTGEDGRSGQRFVVRGPEADLAALGNTRLQVAGADDLRLEGGSLRIVTGLGDLSLELAEVVDARLEGLERTGVLVGPVVNGAGQPALEVAAPFRPAGTRGQVGAQGAQDLLSSTYFGGTQMDSGKAIAVDGNGQAFIAGDTRSFDLPVTAGAFQSRNRGGLSVFVTKFNAAGSGLVYSTYVGGSGDENTYDLTIDGSGNAYVTGQTNSTDFPIAGNFYDMDYNGAPFDSFVFSLNNAGTGMQYSGFLGGSSGDYGTGIAVDNSAAVYVVGYTQSADFPTTPGAFQRTLVQGNNVAYVTKLNPGGGSLAWSTYFGGTGGDFAYGVAVDSGGNVYFAGVTASINFPVSQDAFQRQFKANSTGFVAKLSADGSRRVYATYLGGSGNDKVNAISIDGSGNAYVTGQTQSPDFPTTPGAFDRDFGGAPFTDAFVSVVNATGTNLNYSTFLGGSDTEFGYDIQVDGQGRANVVGATSSKDFPVTSNAYQQAFGRGSPISGTRDAFLVQVNPAGSDLLYATYLGGSDDDIGYALMIDSPGNVYLTGQTASGNFPTTPGAYKTTFVVGDAEAFVSKILPSPQLPTPTPTSTPTYSPTPLGTPAQRVFLPLVTRSVAGGW